MSNFNMFEVLSKDDKELIHSAFLAFITSENPSIIGKKLFDLEMSADMKITTEVNLNKRFDEECSNKELCKYVKQAVKRLEKKDRIKLGRNKLDLLIAWKNDKSIVALENKFKSFPSNEQLELYDIILDILAGQQVKVERFLLCFNKEIAKERIDNENWKILEYEDLITPLNNILKQEQNKDKKLFIEHYVIFLKKYMEAYKKLFKNPKLLRSLLCINKRNQLHNANLYERWPNFWKRLFLQRLMIKLGKENFEFGDDTGVTTTPFLNVRPRNWLKERRLEDNSYEILVQVQGSFLKLYVEYYKNHHKKVIKVASNIIKDLRETSWANGSFKEKLPSYPRKNKRDDTSFYIYRQDMLKTIKKGQFTCELIANEITEFYRKTGSIVMKQLRKQ